METKLESVLRNFSANPSPDKFRKDIISKAKNKLKAMEDLNLAQRYLNTYGGVDNLSVDQIVQDVLMYIDEDIALNPEKINQYLPKEENDKFQAQIEEVKKKFPLDESKKGTEEYKIAKNRRQLELNKVENQKFKALLKYVKLSNTKRKLITLWK